MSDHSQPVEATPACRLCRESAPLRNSHLLPAFVAQWLRRTSATGYLRSYLTPNLREQDFRTVKLLCGQCEERFSAAESEFARRLFYPLHEQGRSKFAYDQWLQYFVVSMAWRCSQMPLAAPLPENLMPPLLAAAETWRTYLLGERADPGPHRHDLFFTPYGGKANFQTPPYVNSYFGRSVDMTPVHSAATIGTFVKLPGLLLWCAVVPVHNDGWTGTMVKRHGTIRSKGQEMKDDRLGDFIFRRIRAIAERVDGTLSDNQARRIESAARRDPARLHGSLSFKSLSEDIALALGSLGKKDPWGGG